MVVQHRAGQVFPGGFSGGVTPVPIPNTVAKPSSADGTGNGRVGRRRGLFLTLTSLEVRVFFVSRIWDCINFCLLLL